MDHAALQEEFLSLVKVDGLAERYSQDICEGKYFGMPLKAIVTAEKRLLAKDSRGIAYFSMEYGLATSFYNKFSSHRPINENNKTQTHEVFSNNTLADYFFTLNLNNIIDLPIYSGGLGVLAGDTAKTMADYKLPAVCIGILWNAGYFKQRIWFKYGQLPEAIQWDTNSYPGLIPLENTVKISFKTGELYLKLWKYYVFCYDKHYAVPLILLDANIQQNNEQFRHLTDQLYKSDNDWTKIMQRLILGMGGISALKELGYNIDIYHMNEGHSAFAYLEKAKTIPKEERAELKKHFTYTCHTPVDAGHDRFRCDELSSILNNEDYEIVESCGKDKGNVINFTLLAMNVSSRINAVSKNHQHVMHLQFPKYKDRIDFVTNGVHHHTWMSDRFKALLKEFADVFGNIKANPMALIKAEELRLKPEFRSQIWKAHQENKADLCKLLNKWNLKQDLFTVCWARRLAAYKRPTLILQDMQKLVEIAKICGPIQIIFAGKAHPKDNLAFNLLNQILEKVDSINNDTDSVRIILLENYDVYLAKILISSVDLWLNNPLPPFEASGTSGMKAMLNGVLQLSTVDGWVAEAQDKEIGRFFGYKSDEEELGNEQNLRLEEDSQQLYASIEELTRLYYETNKKTGVDISSKWIDMMINCIACAAHFNTYRMLDEYKKLIWNIP